MTDEEAVKLFLFANQRIMENFIPGSYCMCVELQRNKAAISALRARIERRNPQPLTPEELRGMIGCWVWVVVKYERAECTGWAFVAPGYLALLEQEIPFDSYGTKVFAYRTKPEPPEREGNDG